MPKTFVPIVRPGRRGLALAVAVLSLAVLTACGSAGDESASSAPGNAVDRAFVANMVPHHQGAIEMADIALSRGESDVVRNLAQEIVTAQQREISILQRVDRRLASAGVEVGDLGVPEHEAGIDSDVATLREADPFDREFIDMMVPHHQGAIRMARVEIRQGQNPELKALAQEIIEAQAREIDEMNTHRRREFGEASPGGGVPAEEDGGAATTEEDGDGGHGGGHGG